jgi:hypothetical protein
MVFKVVGSTADDSRGLSRSLMLILKCDYIPIPSWQLFSLAVAEDPGFIADLVMEVIKEHNASCHISSFRRRAIKTQYT